LDGAAPPKRQGNTWIIKAMRQKLISADIAIEIARRVTLNRYGQSELDKILPLTALEEGDNWIVVGTFPPDIVARFKSRSADFGPMRMTISSWDGQILDYQFLEHASWTHLPEWMTHPPPGPDK